MQWCGNVFGNGGRGRQ